MEVRAVCHNTQSYEGLEDVSVWCCQACRTNRFRQDISCNLDIQSIRCNLQAPTVTEWLQTEGFMIQSDALCGETYDTYLQARSYLAVNTAATEAAACVCIFAC